MKSESSVYSELPADAVWSCSFGYPGNGGFSEYYRQPNGQRWRITNGTWDGPKDWNIARVEG